MVDQARADAYNRWQFRNDSWSRLEEPTARINSSRQVFSQEILSFMRSLDTPEIHGYQPALGYRVYTSKALEMLAERPGS
jgi:hypothetical protein